MNFYVNEWKMSGEVFYLKEMEGEFAASLKIKGIAQRPGLYSKNKLEFPCLMTASVYSDAKRRGI